MTHRKLTLRIIRRPGFTLVEMLIALTLSVMLVSAIYAAVTLHWRYQQVGRERIDRTQVTLAVLRLLSEDVRSVEFIPPEPVVEETEAALDTGTDAETDAASTETATDTTTTSATTTQQASLGIVGTAEMLQLDISQAARVEHVTPADDSDESSTLGSRSAPSDTVRVTWGMANVDAMTASTQPDDAASSQLARQVVDRLQGAVSLDASADSEEDLEPQTLDAAGIIAPEVVSLAFRYFDGYSWFDTWDSIESQRLPRAIEVSMGFRKTEFKPAGSLNLPGQEPVVILKHVILVPAATPLSGAEL